LDWNGVLAGARPGCSALKAVKPSLTPPRRNVPKTAELLCCRHSEAKASKLAGREQQRARQARSRNDFAFWAAVAAEIELQKGIAPGDREAE
jgi:hypothetical protein